MNSDMGRLDIIVVHGMELYMRKWGRAQSIEDYGVNAISELVFTEEIPNMYSN